MKANIVLIIRFFCLSGHVKAFMVETIVDMTEIGLRFLELHITESEGGI